MKKPPAGSEPAKRPKGTEYSTIIHKRRENFLPVRESSDGCEDAAGDSREVADQVMRQRIPDASAVRGVAQPGALRRSNSSCHGFAQHAGQHGLRLARSMADAVTRRRRAKEPHRERRLLYGALTLVSGRLAYVSSKFRATHERMELSNDAPLLSPRPKMVEIVRSDFKPAWWLPTAHLQTLWPTLFRRIPPPGRRRERLSTFDKDFVDLDWCGETPSPIVMLLHGLSGSSDSNYIKGMQHALLLRGYRSVAMNFRGCGGEPNRLARSYHSGDTEDLDILYRHLRRREPETPIAAIGYSLGGNVLLKWLGERCGSVSLFAAAAVSVPMLLSACADRMDKGLSVVYRDHLIRELKCYIQDKLHHLERHECTEEAEKLRNLGDLSDTRSFWEYDDRVVAKLYAFEDAHDYYHQSSSRHYLCRIRVPTLIIQAADDPFMTPEVLPSPQELTPFIFFELSEKGGHVGFIAGTIPGKPIYWLEHRIPQFLAAHLPPQIV